MRLAPCVIKRMGLTAGQSDSTCRGTELTHDRGEYIPIYTTKIHAETQQQLLR